MAKIKLYVRKDDLFSIQIEPVPASSELENYYEVELEEDEAYSLPLHYVFDPSTRKFVPDNERLLARAHRRRKSAYETEADPLHKEWQYLLSINSPEAPAAKEAWLGKIREIKERHPKPEVSR
jgi:hypothetical protein